MDRVPGWLMKGAGMSRSPAVKGKGIETDWVFGWLQLSEMARSEDLSGVRQHGVGGKNKWAAKLSVWCLIFVFLQACSFQEVLLLRYIERRRLRRFQAHLVKMVSFLMGMNNWGLTWKTRVRNAWETISSSVCGRRSCCVCVGFAFTIKFHFHECKYWNSQ